jgi:hypothetical protein
MIGPGQLNLGVQLSSFNQNAAPRVTRKIHMFALTVEGTPQFGRKKSSKSLN